MATLSNKEIARAIYIELHNKSDGEQKIVLQKILRFLREKRLFSKSKEILDELQKIVNQKNKILDATIHSPVILDEHIKRELAQSLRKRYSLKNSIEKVFLTERVDKSLLGGFKIEVDDEVLDLSIKNRIGKLQEYLTQNV